VIKVSCQTVKTPTLAGSPHSVEMYYEVDSVPDTAKVIHHLRDTVKFLDPSTVLVEATWMLSATERSSGMATD
jgi:hypothetical protein